MHRGPPSFSKFWEELSDETPLRDESRKEFRRRMDKQLNLLERLALEWESEADKLEFLAKEELERDLYASARSGLDRIRRTGEADVALRRRRSARAQRLSE